MGRAAGFTRDDTVQAKVAKLRTLLAPTLTPMEDLALLAELNSLPSTDIAPPLDVTPQKKKEIPFDALLRQLELLSRQPPVLIAFEDLHWLDPSSREMLDQWIPQVPRLPVLLIATFRPEYRVPWTAQPHITMLTLPRLDLHDTAAMVEDIAGPAALPADIIREIAERADGIPLFVEELTKAILEAGDQGIAALTAMPHPEVAIPATLHASLLARLDRLGSATKDVAQKGSVIGREFSRDLIAHIADRPDPELQQALDRLADSGLLLVRGTAPDFTYIFKHALVQDAAYGTLLRSRRQQLHTRIGSVLETQFPDVVEARPELLAHHFTEAGLVDRAAEYWLKAGRHALARSAMKEAEALLRKGLGLVHNAADGVLRQEQELGLQICLGQALFATQGWAAAGVGEAYARARELCRQLEQPQKMLPILYGQWINHTMRGEMERAQRLAGEIRQLGGDRGDRIADLMGYWAGGFTSLHLGDFAEARVHFEEGSTLFDPVQRRQYLQLTPIDALVFLSTQLSLAQACLGFLDRARSRRDLGIAEARRLAHAHTLGAALYFCLRTGWAERLDPATLLQETEELLTLSAERGFPHWSAQAVGFRGWCLAASGQPAQGIPLLTAGLEHQRALGSTLYIPHGLTMLADAYRVGGAPEAGLAQISEAERLAEATQVKWVLAETLRFARRSAGSNRRPHGSGGQLSRRDSARSAARRQAVRTARRDQPLPAVARSGQARARAARARLRLVHRGLRRPRSETGESAARRVEVSLSSAYPPIRLRCPLPKS